MGKLYKLRKAIEKDPEKWISSFGGHAMGARFFEHSGYWHKKAGWQPAYPLYDNPKSYRDFVASVLEELGYEKEKKAHWSGIDRWVLKPGEDTEQYKIQAVKALEGHFISDV